MAVVITPGYDFGVNEVPDTPKLFAQAAGLTVTGLGLDAIEASNLIGILGGNTSGTTGASLPSEGWMWSDPMGNLWVETLYTQTLATSYTDVSVANRPCFLWKCNGGWATTRYANEGDTAGALSIQGMGSECLNLLTTFREEDVYIDATIRQFAQGAIVQVGVHHDSPASGARLMLHGRGWCALTTNGVGTEDVVNYLYSDASTGWELVPVGTVTVGIEYAQSWARHPEGSTFFVYMHPGPVFQ